MVAFEAERVVANDDRIMPFVWVRGEDEDGEATQDALEADPSVATLDRLTDLDGEWLYRVEWTDRIDALLYARVEEEGTVLSATGRDGYWTLRFLFADRDALRRTYDHCESVGLNFDAEQIYHLDEGRQGRLGLTDKQQDVLHCAHELGYYETEIHHGRLYPNLDTLVDKGLVEKGQRDRRTNYYSLARRGRREIEAQQDWKAQYLDALEELVPAD